MTNHDPRFYTYDWETYPNFCSVSIKHLATGKRWRFEISEWVDQSLALYNTLVALRFLDSMMVGFNNLNFDYPLTHFVIENQGVVNYKTLYAKAQFLLSDKTGYRNIIYPDKRFIPQIDLYKIHHFDNHAKATSLKELEYNMQSPNIVDLPFPPGTVLTRDEADIVLRYNDHDVDETEKFLIYSLPSIAFREKLSKKYDRDFMNHNDTKIGKDYFGMVLNENGIPTKINGRWNQTKRDEIHVKDVIVPYIKFERPEFNAALNFFNNQVVSKKDEKGNLLLKGIFNNAIFPVDGFPFKFGSGGLHASIQKTIVRTSETHTIFDIDISSNYPNIAIANRLFPEHLTEKFCDINLDVYNQRSQFTKKQPENGMLKLALNGVYGDSNNEHSFFYDPKYTLSITINGQLLLCMVAEQLMKIPGLTMIQANTDGITFLCPNQYIDHARNIQKWWEGVTKLELEEVEYKRMFIRDVNSYIAEKANGELKRIGAYAYERAADNPATREIAWHKDHGGLVIPKAAEAALVRGVNIENFIREHTDPHDFTFRAKVPRSSYLEMRKPVLWGGDVVTTTRDRLQNIVRYYPSRDGGKMIKVMPPTENQKLLWETGEHYQHVDTGAYVVKKPGVKPPSGKYKPVRPGDPNYIANRADNETSIEANCNVKDCSNMSDFNFGDLDYEYFINETRKLVDPLFSSSI